MTEQELSHIRGEIYGIILVVSRNLAFSCRSKQEAQEVRQQIENIIEYAKSQDNPFEEGIAVSMSDILSIFNDILKPELQETTTSTT